MATTTLDPPWQGLTLANRQEILASLMRAHGAAIHRYCLGFMGEAATAEDVLQTVFLQAFKGLGGFQGRSRPRTWLFRIAHHRCLDALKARRRARRRIEYRAELPEVAAADLETATSNRQLCAQVQAALDALPDATRGAVIMRYQLDMTYPEIAAVLGLREGTVQARVARALPRVRQQIQVQIST